MDKKRARRQWFNVLLAVWQRLSPYLTGNGWLLVVVAVASLATGLGEAAVLYLIVLSAAAITAGDEQVDVAIGPIRQDGISDTAVYLACGVLLIAVVLLAILVSAAGAALASRTLTRAREETSSAFLSTSWALQSKEPEGRLLSVLNGHVQRIGTAALQMANGIAALVTFLAYMAAALFIDPVAAGVTLIGVGLVGLMLLPLARLTHRISTALTELNLAYARMIVQTVRLARELRAFDVDEPVARDLRAQADRAERVAFRSRFVATITPRVFQYLALLLVLFGIAAASSKEGDAAGLGAIVLLLVRGLSYGQRMSTSAQALAEARPLVEDVARLQRGYEEERLDRTGDALPHVTELEISNLSYAYEAGEPVLSSISVRLRAGDAVGLVGPSGGGKSTLVQILLRLREQDDGRYLVNGQPASSFARSDWSRRFAFVPQDNQLVAASVLENIRFFREDLPDSTLMDAARSAHLHDDILALPDGYETILGPGGRDLSGGQRQRLGLARALAADPDVLILDEPTSALDMQSEELIQATLQNLRGSVTLIIIAHRISTLSICDRVVVLEGGQIVAQGSHDEVEGSSPFYSEALRLSRR